MSTSIEWTQKTWNPVRGCSRVSEGCRHCYAESFAARNLTGMRSPTTGKPFAVRGPRGPQWTGAVELIPSMLDRPLRWRKAKRVFVNSMSDLFHETLDDAAIAWVFAVMAAAKHHTFQVLTKRPERMRRWASEERNRLLVSQWSKGNLKQRVVDAPLAPYAVWPLPNVWLGVSVEDQATADERIPLLLQTPAAVRFVSYEPALGPVDFGQWVAGTTTIHVCADVEGMIRNRSFSGLTSDAGLPLSRKDAEAGLRALLARGVKLIPGSGCDDFDPEKGCRGHRRPRLDWVIVGGESGPGARPFDVAWMRAVVAQCRAAGVAAFCKQIGAAPYDGDSLGAEQYAAAWRLKDRKGGDPGEWGPGDWPREFPEARA